MSTTIVWFENDLRVKDHDALRHAVQRGGCVVPLFIWNGGQGWAEGAASRWWLHHSLESLAGSLEKLDLPLTIRKGSPALVLAEVVRETGADMVVWQRRSDPVRSAYIQRAIANISGIQTRSFGGELLHDPDAIQTGSGTPYKVFTPFHKRFMADLGAIPNPQEAPHAARSRRRPELASLAVSDLKLLPAIDWANGLDRTWSPGEAGAAERLETLADLTEYIQTRDIPSLDGTSRLSPHLHFGEVSPRQVWHAAEGMAEFRRQLVWREFAHHLLYHFPDTRRKPLRPKFERLPWRRDDTDLRRWQRGLTGFPIVDAGMRQLWKTGWMHNRVRMIVASFLTKDLLHSWLDGQDWFNETLVDADLANNTLGWQWASGSGADAQPFFRIFNPVLQGKKFDPEGAFVREWIPELKSVDTRYIHEPWRSDLTMDYPAPIVDHGQARDRALDAFEILKFDD